MICSISGEVPVDPVVSPRSGAVFERKNVVSYLTTHGTDPVNDEPLTIEELVTIKSPMSHIVPPKPPQFTSIPALLSTFQNEWDALALEVFTLRKLLHKARQELSSALYHQDAAVRVAANALRERDEAKQALQELAISIGQDDVNGALNQNSNHTNGATKNAAQIPVDDINKARDELYALHKSHKPSLSVAPEQAVSLKFNSSIIHPFKLVEKSYLLPHNKQILLASKSKLIQYQFSDQVSSNLSRKKAAIVALNYVSLQDELKPIIAYKDKVYIGDEQFSTSLVNVFQVIVHPKLSNLFILLSKDSWSINDSANGELYVGKLADIVCGDIHVDGAIVAIATREHVKVFSVTNGEEVSQFTTTYSEPVKLKFGLNGYWLFAASKSEEAGSIDVIDLRKNLTVHSVEVSVDIKDFDVDPSTSFIISYDNELKLHRYVKKGKKWLDNIAQLQPLETLTAIRILNDENDSDFINNDQLKVIAVSETSSVLEYELEYEQK